MPKIPQQGRGRQGCTAGHGCSPPRHCHLPFLSSCGQWPLPRALGTATPPCGVLHLVRTEKSWSSPVPSVLEAFRLQRSHRAPLCPSASPATAAARTKLQRHQNWPNGPEAEARTPQSLPKGRAARPTRLHKPPGCLIPFSLSAFPLAGSPV